MRRREFVTLVGGAVATWPLIARAQQPAMPVIGFLNAASRKAYAHQLANFLKGLGETGYVEGSNFKIEYRPIPIVFEIGGDPIELGLVASLSRPGVARGAIRGAFAFGLRSPIQRGQLMAALPPPFVPADKPARQIEAYPRE